jgi:MFS family permease
LQLVHERQAPYFIRAHGVSTSEVGIFLGLGAALGGFIGVTFGGWLSDWLKRTTPRARPFMGIGVVVALLPFAIIVFTTSNVVVGYVASFFTSICASAWNGSAVALAGELVVPRMRAAASAFYILCATFIGLALGPYVIGRISDALGASTSSADALSSAILISLSASVLAIWFFWLSSKHIEADEGSRVERARLLGEPI